MASRICKLPVAQLESNNPFFYKFQKSIVPSHLSSPVHIFCLFLFCPPVLVRQVKL